MMDVARASLLIALLIYSVSVLPHYCSSQRPATGVRLFLESGRDSGLNDGQILANNSLVSSGSVSSDYGLACYSADETTNTIGDWFSPNGRRVERETGDQQQVLFAHNQIGRVTLQIRDNRPFPSDLEGIYSCLIPDENSVLRTLYVGLYSPTNYQNSAGPVVPSPVEFQLLSHAYAYPPIFTVTCISTAFPPTRLEWRLNGSPLDLSSNSFSSSQQMRDATSLTYYNILTVSGSIAGQYSCSVANDRGSNSANITVNGPSGAPTIDNVSSIGNNSVLVRWSPPAAPAGIVRGYRVFYTTGSTTNTLTVGNALAASAEVSGLTLGVQYSITVQAFADFPSPNSTADSIMLNAPGTPQSVSVTIRSSSSLQVWWNSPINEVNGYKVSYSPVESCDGVPGGAVMVDGAPHLLSNLEAYTEYSITVRARGTDGLGAPSTPGTGRTEADVPGPPQMVSVSNGSSIGVRWREPNCRDVNDVRVTGYQIRYGKFSDTQRTTLDINSGTTMPFTISGNGLTPFTDYSIEVAAVNSKGVGAFSQPMIGVITGAPGRVSSLSTVPDILSVVLNWGHPRQGEGHITEYEIRHSLGTSLLGIKRVSGEPTSFRVTGLQPDMQYRFEIRAFIDQLEGPSDAVTARTLVVSQVQGVSVRQLNSSAVNVSWSRFNSEDVFYRIYYWSPPGQVDFPGNSSWGVLNRLQSGQTQFQVAAVVIIQGVPMEGERSETTCPNGACPSDNAGAIAGAIIATVIVLAMIAIFIVIYLMWNRGRSGKFEVSRRRSSALNLKSKHTPLPLLDFDKPTITSAKPIIVKQPKDVIALEGEKVTVTPEVAGVPPPSIAWYYDGGMVTPDYATEISDKGQLTFVCVEKKHAGVYRFTVSNNAGSIQGQVSIFVRSEDDDVDTAGIPQIESNCISVSEFGSYTEEQHANSNRGFRDQYFSLSSGEDGHQVKCALMTDNKLFNRFTNITVYDDNRVKLKAIAGRPDCHHDYINASYIDGYFLPKKFIATQGPTDKTVVDFWRLVWQARAPTIVMITNLIEGTRVKCSQYWPERGAQEYGPFKVILKDETIFADYTIRTFILILTTKTQPPLKVVQYHFTTWPDHGVPEYVSPMLAFHRRVNADHKSARGPMVVHCSAGVGRTGTFTAIDIALQQAEGEGNVDIPSILTKLRNQRMKMVQTLEQYVFIHDAVLESLVCGNTQIPADDFRTTFEALKQTQPDTNESGFQAQFNVLEQVTPKFDLALCPTAVLNEDKNRTMDHVPTDRWRVILKAEHPDYIHANFVNGYKQKKAFIITQGPMENTCRDFWKMVYERDCSSIVMLSGIIENDLEVCHRYWPQHGLQQYGEFSVSVMEESMHEGHLERVFSVTDSKSGQAHRVSQFQVFSWNRNGTTTNPRAIIGAITSSILLQKRNNSGPIVAHCSDTVIRSAMFCALAACIECCKTEGSLDVFQVVKVLRNQKPGAVPTLETFQNIYELLVYYLEEAGGLVDSSSIFQ